MKLRPKNGPIDFGYFVDYYLELQLNLSEDFKDSDVEILGNWKSSTSKYYDLVLIQKSKEIAFFEIKDNISLTSSSNNTSQENFESTSLFFLISLKEGKIYLTDYKKSNPYQEVTYKQVVDKIKDLMRKLNEDILDVIGRDFVDYMKMESLGMKLKDDTITLINRKLKPIMFTLNQQLELEFKNKTESGFENQLFKSMLTESNNRIARYMSLESFYLTIKESKMYFGSIFAMNDKREFGFFEKIVEKEKSHLEKCTDSDIEIGNKNFITSYVTEKKQDSLTLWRLYGDNATGVCLVFQIDNKKNQPPFYISKVNYCDESEDDAAIFLKKLRTYKYQTNSPTQQFYTFRFNKSLKWKYFFKANDFSDEDEVRVLYHYNESEEKSDKIKLEWRLINNIIVPSVLIPINYDKFPLTLKKIIIGPRAFEKEVNVRQIKQFLSDNGFDTKNIDVKPSEIDNYR